MSARLVLRRGFDLLLLGIGLGAFVYLARVDGDPSPRGPTGPSGRPAFTARPTRVEPRRGPIRIGWTAWTDAEVIAHLAEHVLQERMGFEVELVMADIGIQYQGLANQELDVMLMAWLPVTHADYWARVAPSVVDLGPIYTRARLGWAVPAHVPEAELGSMEDLARPEVRARLSGRIQGIDPGSGLMQASERALGVYGLEGYELVAASGAAMTAAVGRAIARGDWIVVTAWSPHWMFAEWELRYLEDPRGALGGWERVHALTRVGFDQDYPPAVTEMLSRLEIPLPQLERALLTATTTSVEQAVREYLREHGDRVDYWVSGRLPHPGPPKAPPVPP